MCIELEPGVYIVAVSGGVDSVVLLDLLSKEKNLKLIVAHFDHGIRSDSANDRKFVGELAAQYGYPFEYAEGNLGKDASEAEARVARYKFLREVKDRYNADAIVTAHHQDDLIETIILNLLRGTGRRGITSLGEQADLRRPLLNMTKQELISYAQEHRLEWHEDSTNTDQAYLRNWIRLNLMPKLDDAKRKHLLAIYKNVKNQNQEIDTLMTPLVAGDHNKLPRQLVMQADHAVSKEIIANWLRTNGIADFDQKTIERIVIGTKTLKAGKTIPVIKNASISVKNKTLMLVHK